jgi:hypothetical protein
MDVCYYGMSEPGQPLIPERSAVGIHTKALNWRWCDTCAQFEHDSDKFAWLSRHPWVPLWAPVHLVTSVAPFSPQPPRLLQVQILKVSLPVLQRPVRNLVDQDSDSPFIYRSQTRQVDPFLMTIPPLQYFCLWAVYSQESSCLCILRHLSIC